jgi:Uncharacterized protein conserved in bacteria
MGTTKIIVLHLKQIIKSCVFTLIGLILIGLLIFVFIPKNKEENQKTSSIYTPGIYSSQIILHNKPVNIEVNVNENEILAIKLNDINETQEVFYPLFKPTMEMLSREIIHYQSLDIPTINDYAVTGKILISAVDNALQKARVY